MYKNLIYFKRIILKILMTLFLALFSGLFISFAGYSEGSAIEKKDNRIKSVSIETDFEPISRYYRLRKLYSKWHVGLYGSRRYYEIQIEELLKSFIGKIIETGDDFRIVYPSGNGKVFLSPALFSMRWLRIETKINHKSLEKLLKRRGEGAKFLKKSWRSNFLVSFSGRLRSYRIGKDMKGDYVHLNFYSVKLK